MDLKFILQIIGIILGLIYLWLEYKAHIGLWIVGLIMPCVHGYLYYISGLYADCAMNGYYVFAGIYGWIVWARGTKKKQILNISHIPLKQLPKIIGIYIIVHIAIYLFLIKLTNSTVPFWDSTTTALSIIAMWLLSRKYVEQWLVWIFVDAITVGLYIYKGIPYTASLYLLYTILAIAGYLRWKKEIINYRNFHKF